MQAHDSYPYLAHLLGAYFHQDAFDDEPTFEGIVADYKQTSNAYEQLGLRADIQRFLHLNDDNPAFLRTFCKTFAPDVIVGTSDSEAREWLARVLSLLDE